MPPRETESAAKREAPAEGANAQETKRQRLEERAEDLVEKLHDYSKQLRAIDLVIAKEVIAVNRAHWPKLKQIYAERESMMTGIWGSLVSGHPRVVTEYMVSPVEIPFFNEHLKSVDLEEYIDENGSYEVKFTFAETASPLIEPLVWRKKVVFQEDCETVDEEKTEVTKITFKTDGMNPFKTSKDSRKAFLEAVGAKESDLEEIPAFSIATWFSEKAASVAGDYGDIFRKLIYPRPDEVFESMGEEDSDDDDNEDEEDEDEEDAAVGDKE